MRDIAKEVAEYTRRMQHNTAFSRWGVTPQWTPGAHDVNGFIHDEVVRQGHNVNVDEGKSRLTWMGLAWDLAMMISKERLPSHNDIIRLGAYIEAGKNSPHHWREEDVLIGSGTGCPPSMLNTVMPMLCSVLSTVEPVPQRSNDGAHADEIRQVWLYGIRPESEMFQMLMALFNRVQTADDWYLAFEAVHPFLDGNGRVGKILHNWLLGTLDNPVLVHDYFGGGNP